MSEYNTPYINFDPIHPTFAGLTDHACSPKADCLCSYQHGNDCSLVELQAMSRHHRHKYQDLHLL
jgi:hypothetical protein